MTDDRTRVIYNCRYLPLSSDYSNDFEQIPWEEAEGAPKQSGDNDVFLGRREKKRNKNHCCVEKKI